MATVKCQKVGGVDIPCALVGGGGGEWEGNSVALGTYEPQAVSATAPMHSQKYCVSAVPIQSLKWLAMGT